MSGFLEKRGISPEELRWEDLALCRGLPTEFFFDWYAKDARIAKSVDEMCLACPVMAHCAMKGKEDGETGVWGAIYWSASYPSDTHNEHKSKGVWDAIMERLSDG